MGTGLDVIIVDDEPDILELLQYNLSKEGFEIHTASNGAEALTRAVKIKPDMIILDVMMPNMDGFEVCKNLRKSAKTKDIPIILLTAKGTIEDKITGFGSGADDYLVKPFDIQELFLK